MGIYTRDQIQYANMIQNALQNRARDIERKYDAFAKRGEMYGNAARNIGNSISDAFMKYATYADTQEAAQAQRDFQAEQSALRNKEAMDRLAREQAFQAEQNQLNRDNILAISQNRFEQGQAEKKASDRKNAMTDLEINNATLTLINDELGRTDDPQRLAELNEKKAKTEAKIKSIYTDYPDLKPAEPKVPQYNQTAGQETPADTQAENQEMQSEIVAKFTADLENSKNSESTAAALQGLRGIDPTKLDKSEKEKRQKSIADGEAKLADQKEKEARRAKRKAEHDRLKEEAGTNASKLSDLQTDYPEFYK